MMFPKTQYVRSPKLMKAYREIPCQHCGRDDGTVCGAHSNSHREGKGKGIKASDDQAASLCARCHTQVDQSYTMTGSERVQMWAQARVKTVHELLRRGLWPMDVPVPDVRSFDA